MSPDKHLSGMHRRAFLAIAGIVGMAGCSSDGDGPDEDGGDSDTGTAQGGGTHEFDGTDGTVTDEVSLESGLTVIEATFDGDGNHTIDLLRPDGSATPRDFVQRANTYQGEQAFHVDGGEYVVDVSTSGAWEVILFQPRPQDSDANDVPERLNGGGDTVEGPYQFDGSYSLEGVNNDDGYLHTTIYSVESQQSEHALQNVQTNDETLISFDEIGYIELTSSEDWELAIDAP